MDNADVDDDYVDDDGVGDDDDDVFNRPTLEIMVVTLHRQRPYKRNLAHFGSSFCLKSRLRARGRPGKSHLSSDNLVGLLAMRRASGDIAVMAGFFCYRRVVVVSSRWINTM